jgi:hypothetical protein
MRRTNQAEPAGILVPNELKSLASSTEFGSGLAWDVRGSICVSL